MPLPSRSARRETQGALVVCALIAAAGCGLRPHERSMEAPAAAAQAKPAAPQAEKGPVSLSVRAGAALQPPMDEIGDLYRRKTGVRIDLCYAGAQMLLGQLVASRSGDLYMPGEAFWVDQAAKRGFVAHATTVVYFLPVVMVPKGNPGKVHDLRDMARPGVRVAMGHPDALAVGPVTKHILTRAGIWDAVQRNVIMEAGCIPELANAVAMKGAQAGILWDACAYQVREHVDTIPIDPKYNEVAEVLVASLKLSKHPREAADFEAYVASPEARAIFTKHGFLTERPKGVRLAPREAVKKK